MITEHGKPSLRNLIEGEDTGLEILHPGGLEITRELAELCHIGRGKRVLEVASGTGESASYLVKNFGCQLVGVDISDYMIERARRKAKEKGITIEFQKGDAHDLSFNDNTFDAVISECTICLLNKERAISEMVRVVKSSGYVGIHDICWKEDTPKGLKQKYAEIERGEPETLEGWKNLFDGAGLKDIITVDKSYLVQDWVKDIKNKIGMVGQLKIFLKVIKKWGISGYKSIRESEEIFQGKIKRGIVINHRYSLNLRTKL